MRPASNLSVGSDTSLVELGPFSGGHPALAVVAASAAWEEPWSLDMAPRKSLMANILFDGSGLGGTLPGLPAHGSLPAALSIPRLPTEDAFQDLLLPAVAAYWSHYNRFHSAIHRPTFERAFLPTRTRTYGPNPPVSLLYALAANGSRHISAPHLSDSDRARCGRHFSDKAKDLVLAGFFSRPEAARAVTALEALQVLGLLFEFFVPSGLATHMYPLMERTVELALAVCPDPTGANVVPSSRPPRDAVEWAEHEMRARAWTTVCIRDVAYAFHAGREPLHGYFSRRLVLPAHERFFDMDQPEQAFAALHTGPDRAPPVVFDFSALADPSLPPDRRRATVREVVGPCFSGRLTYGALFLVNCFLRTLRIRARSHALAHGVAPLALAAQDPAFDTPAERTYRVYCDHVEALVADVYAALPPPLAAELAAGRPAALFRDWPAQCHYDRSYAFQAAAFLVNLQSFAVESYVQGPLPSAGPSVLRSPPVLRAVHAARAATGLLATMLAEDPLLDYLHYTVYPAALRCGHLLLAARALDPEGGFEAEVRAVSRVLDRLGHTFAPLGGSPLAVAARPGGKLTRRIRRRGQDRARLPPRDAGGRRLPLWRAPPHRARLCGPGACTRGREEGQRRRGRGAGGLEVHGAEPRRRGEGGRGGDGAGGAGERAVRACCGCGDALGCCLHVRGF
ncbi:hypothetical protein DFJ74DRAFT_37957 [Hyaloraphidium curvatum]|nr:hypothetical protein DFJ74DRAFT_37957 [Hyaloraphidium curvatum]